MLRWGPVGFVGLAVTSVLLPWLLVRFVRAFTVFFETAMVDPAAQPPMEFFTLSIGSQILSFVNIAGLLLAGFWMYRAATAATHLGLPARHDPVWAVAGWFIPIINFWWPCQSLQDLLPSEHPTRSTILWVWVVFITAGFVMWGGVVYAALVDGTTPLVVIAVGAMLNAAGWLSAARLVPTVLAEHERLAAP